MPNSLAAASCCSVARRHLVTGVLFVLGLATTVWVVTALRQRSAPEPETVDVLVAAKDLPVGTMITRDDLKDDTVVKVKKVPKGELPPAFVTDKEMLLDKKLTRPYRAEQLFHPQDLYMGLGHPLPPPYNMVSLPGTLSQAGGAIEVGSRVDVLAAVRRGDKLYSFPLLVNMLVVVVGAETTYSTRLDPNLSTVTLALTDKQALALALAKSRGCTLQFMPRPVSTSFEAVKDFDLDKVMKVLNDERNVGVNIVYGLPAEEPIDPAPAPRPVGERP
jgi:Flp pilus assembly protein CpaB